MSSSIDSIAQKIVTEGRLELDIGNLLGSDTARATTSSDRELQPISLDGFTNQMNCALALNHDCLAIGSQDNTIGIWKATTKSGFSKAESPPLSGHKAPVCALALVSLVDENTSTPVDRLISGSIDSTVLTWDLSTGQAIGKVTLEESAVWNTGEFVRDPSGCVLVLVMSEMHVHFYSLKDGKRVSKENPIKLEEHKFSVIRVLPNVVTAQPGPAAGMQLKRTPNGPGSDRMYTLATGDIDGLVHLWNIRVKSCAVKCVDVVELGENSSSEKHTRIIRALVALPDDRLASASDDGTVRLWNLRTRECTQNLNCGSRVFDVCALRNGTPGNHYILAVLVLEIHRGIFNSQKQVQLWDVDRGIRIATNSLKESGRLYLKGTFLRVEAADSLDSVLVLERRFRGLQSILYNCCDVWPIALPKNVLPNGRPSRLGFEDLKRLLLAIHTQARGTQVQLKTLDLTALRLCDDEVNELLLYLRTLSLLTRVVLSCDGCQPPKNPRFKYTPRFEAMESIANNVHAENLSARALVRIFLGLHYICLAQFRGPEAEIVLLLGTSDEPVSWRRAYESVERLDAELQAELVAASHASIIETFTRALDVENINTEQLVHMFNRVLYVSDLSWPYTLLIALLIGDPTFRERNGYLLMAFKSALKWVANHAMFNEKSVSALKSMLFSAHEYKLLQTEEENEITECATKCDVFSDDRYTALVEKVEAIRIDLGALEKRMTFGFGILAEHVNSIEQRTSQVEKCVQAVVEDLKRLREAFRNKQRRDAAFKTIKVILSLVTCFVGGVGGSVVEVLAGMCNFGSFSELTIAGTKVIGQGTKIVARVTSKSAELVFEEFSDKLRNKWLGNPNEMINQWNAAYHESEEFTDNTKL